jgi:subtilisin
MTQKNRFSALATCVLLVALLSGLFAHPAWGQQPERVKVLVAFGHQPGPAEEALVRGMGGSVKYRYHLVPAIAATLPQPAISALEANPRVTRVEPDLQMRALEIVPGAELENSWGVKRIGAGTVHASGNKGDGIKLAIIDSGINYNHPDLTANYAGGDDFVELDGDPMDVYGHGTHVAGTACAEDNDNGDPDGPYGVVGVAPACDLYGLKVLDDGGWGYASDLIAAMQWAVDNGIQVANLSLGWDQNPGDNVKLAFDNAYAAGMVIVAAACNNGNRPGRGDNVCYPALYDSVIAVAATDSSDRRASFSSTGDQVELAAPGVAVLSTWNDDTGYYDPQPVCSPVDGACYKLGSGTSMASPHVAGTAALILAAEPGLTNDDVRARLIATADDLGDAGWDPWYGWGLVDADEAAPPPANDAPVVAITSPVDGAEFASGATITFEGTAGDTEDGDLTAGLEWTSSIDDQIGTGGSFTLDSLSDGVHTITAKVTDSGGRTGSASVSITVGEPPAGPTTVRVDTITYSTAGGRSGDKHLTVTAALVDDLGSPVAGASVSMHLETDLGRSWNFSGTTGAEGTVAFSVLNAPTGCYAATVTDVVADGLTWDESEPTHVPDSFCK